MSKSKCTSFKSDEVTSGKEKYAENRQKKPCKQPHQMTTGENSQTQKCFGEKFVDSTALFVEGLQEKCREKNE